MAQERTLLVKIAGDASSLDKAFKRAGVSGKDYEKQVNLTSKAHDGLVKAFALTSGALLGGAGLVSGFKTAIDAASNLNEQITKTGVVFGAGSKQVQEWSKTTANGIGIARDKALEAAGTFGNMLVPMGFAREKAAAMSISMVKLAADMASFNNASPEDTLLALRSGLAGESEPLRKFGVFLNDARVKQEALNLHLYSGKGNLDAAAKAAATYSIILKDTKDAQGDFSRTSGGLANQQRLLKAQLRDTEATIGTALMPAVLKVTSAMTGWLGKTENQEKIQNAVNGTVKVAGQVIDIMWPKIQMAAHWADQLAQKVGGWDKAFAIITSGFLANKVLGLANSFGGKGGLAGMLFRATSGITGKGGLLSALSSIPAQIAVGIAVGTGLGKVQELIDPGFNQGWHTNADGTVQMGKSGLYKDGYSPPEVAARAAGGGVFAGMLPTGQIGSKARKPLTGAAAIDYSSTAGVDLGGDVAATGGGGGGGSGAAKAIENAKAAARKLAADLQMEAWQGAIDMRKAKQAEVASIFTIVQAHEAELKAEQVAAVKARIDAMKAAVDAKRTVFTGAFGQLGDAAIKAFDAKTAQMQKDLAGRLKASLDAIEHARVALTPEEQALRDFQRTRADAARAATRAEVMAMEDGTDKTARLRELDLDDQERALTDAATASRKARDDEATLKAQAVQDAYDTEKQALDDQRAMEKQAYEDKISALGEYLALREKSVSDANTRIRDTFGEFAGGLDGQIADVLNKLAAVRAAAAGAAAPYAGSTIASIPTNPGFYYPMAAGGDFMVNSPTLFLAGEAGPERATFTRAGTGRSGGVQVIENHSHIYLDGKQISQSVRRELIAAGAAGAPTSVVTRTRTGL